MGMCLLRVAMKRFRIMLEVDVDDDRVVLLRGGKGLVQESDVKRSSVSAIKDMPRYKRCLKVVSSDCIEQKNVVWKEGGK